METDLSQYGTDKPGLRAAKKIRKVTKINCYPWQDYEKFTFIKEAFEV